jgi:hypothetical protein
MVMPRFPVLAPYMSRPLGFTLARQMLTLIGSASTAAVAMAVIPMPLPLPGRVHLRLSNLTPTIRASISRSNLKSAKTLGLTIPESILVRADDVVQ